MLKYKSYIQITLFAIGLTYIIFDGEKVKTTDLHPINWNKRIEYEPVWKDIDNFTHEIATHWMYMPDKP